MALVIKPSRRCELDLLSLGECMVRLSPPGHQRLELASTLEVHAGGGEYNVAYAISRYGLRGAWVSRLVNNPLGTLIGNHARASGMDLSEVVWVPYDDVGRTDRIGLNFTEVGTGVRASHTIFDRGLSSASHMKPGDVDWTRIFEQRGVRWFHAGGIFPALSSSSAAVVKEAMRAARESGTVVSYDLNFRDTLWTSEQAVQTNHELMPYVNVLVGNKKDFQKGLGFLVDETDEERREDTMAGYKTMVRQVIKQYPNIHVVGTTLRQFTTGDCGNWSAMLCHDGCFHDSIRFDGLEIEDPVGGGDAFCSGIAYGMLTGMPPQECVDFGAASGALAQTTRGDTTMSSAQEVLRVMKDAAGRTK